MQEKKKKRSTVERRKKILTMLNEEGQVFVHELSEHFKVSEVTIRNDLDLFESKRLLIRSRGGAMKYENNVSIDFQISEKYKVNYSDRIKIGRSAAALVNDGETIIIASGTTTMEMAKHMKGKTTLNVITNALDVVNQLIGCQNVNIIVPGGTLRKKSRSLLGALAEKNLRSFYVDKVFIGVDGFDTTLGAFTPNIEEAALNQIMIDIAKEVILVTDSSKFARRSLAFICSLDQMDTVVTDDKIDKEDKRKLLEAGVKVIIA